MKKYSLLLVVMLALALTSCGFPVRYTTVRGDGNVITESRRVSGFDSVELSGIGTLIIEQGSSESLEISAEENIMPYLESRVSGGTLVLGVDQFVNIQPTEEITYRLSVIDLSEIETSGLGNVDMTSLDTTQVRIQISGSGKVTIANLMAERLEMEISGLGDISLAGSVDEQRVEVSGAGNYLAGDLESNSAVVRISGSGNATVWAKSDLNVEISGMGTVEYFGSPVIDSEISGAGRLVSVGEK
jgi:carbon monoxide dehydrogenase subunit G